MVVAACMWICVGQGEPLDIVRVGLPSRISNLVVLAYLESECSGSRADRHFVGGTHTQERNRYVRDV